MISDERILRVLLETNIFKLRKIQKEAIQKGLFFRKSFLVCAPSGSGKTLIGEICAIHNIFQGFGKSIYLVPFKALATEKYHHFKNNYSRFNVNVVLSIGDFDVDDRKLSEADIIITTYEKMDSIIRNFYDKEWIFDISTIIIDEIHIIGESSRGPRLESLIVRLNEFLHNPQIIGLSATIANPKFFNEWLNSLGNRTYLINSKKRPVKLHYQIKISQNKHQTIKNIVKKTLEDNGQILIFVNRRKGTQEQAFKIRNIIKNFLIEKEITELSKLKKELKSIKGGHLELRKLMLNGVAFHHAGLLPKERRIIEQAYANHYIKVICCTTTLSAGVNTPARVVILKDFKRYITSGQNIKNFKGFYENGDGFSYFKPFSSNEVFQMLGRAGRPGLDPVGHGLILVNSIDEKAWIEDHYFSMNLETGSLLPKYEDLTSGLNNINTLKEQVLLRIYEEKQITIEKLKRFFEKTYFWFLIKNSIKKEQIPIEQLLMIEEITPLNLLKLHSNPKRVAILKNQDNQVKISKFNNLNISGYIKTKYGVYLCEFDVDKGIRCACGFDNGLSDNFAQQKFSFELCDHITQFLIYLLETPNINIKKHTEEIIPKTIRNQYILSYLFEKGLIFKEKDGMIKCSQFGKLIIRLYLYPVSGVLIRSKLEHSEIHTYQDLIKESYDILIVENRVKGRKMLEPILEWADEEPLENILERYHIMAGDLLSIKDNMERIITFIGIIAEYLSSQGLDLRNDMTKVAEMAETLQIRIHFGIKEELFDLVLRLNNVARVRARILYNAGFHTASQVKETKPYLLNRKTGLGVNLCKNIIETLNK
ncbi:MAG: DEAD/DEAH box helicase [Candidatus Lokiarchaeota archaeon]|nr:DEAD/DEAH box helicase [Candidatus Lokiarchaeota archaeon]MBD3200617.1 DEAD/DEAH box helicase [Candidatus Lokiarchaeota archaeon]